MSKKVQTSESHEQGNSSLGVVRRSSILKDNLATALYMAIKQQEKREQEAGYTSDSALLGGWRENLECLENGYALKIKYD